MAQNVSNLCFLAAFYLTSLLKEGSATEIAVALPTFNQYPHFFNNIWIKLNLVIFHTLYDGLWSSDFVIYILSITVNHISTCFNEETGYLVHLYGDVDSTSQYEQHSVCLVLSVI